MLEGGAALGLAHIGVLQWLEEHRIPINYVAGTSMGGLVGGMYATGNSPDEIRKLVDGIDWDIVLRGEVPYGDLSFRRKQDAEDYPNGMAFGIKQGVRFPEGFNSGHQVGLILDRVALPYSGVKSFDELPIPFACVGTDLVHNKAHTFREGDLSVALRSTMSLPGIFTPVRANDTVYVDGGLLDNLPVDVTREMGADLTIAVHLAVNPLEANSPLSSVGVLGQSLSVVVAANELRSMEMADVLIRVPLEDYTGMDYKKGAEIIKLGYDAAESKALILSRLSVDEATWQAYLDRRNGRRKKVLAPQFIEVAGTRPKLAEEIQHELADHVGKPIDPVSFDQELTYLLGNGRFSSIGYETVEKDGRQGLLVTAKEKEYSPPEVRPLIVIDGGQYDQIQFKLGARITFFDVGSFGAEWRNDVLLGSEHLLASEFYRPFGKDLRWFVAPRGFLDNNQQNFFHKGDLIAEYRNRQAGGGMDFGYHPSRDSELRVGYLAADQKIYPSIGTLIYGTLQGRIGDTSLRFKLDRRNDPVIPTNGEDAYFKSSWFDANPGATSGFALSELRMTKFVPIKMSSIFFSGAGGTTYTYHKTGFPPFDLGGGPDLVAYGKNEFLSNQYFLFKGGYIHPLWEMPPIIGKKIYAVAAVEGGKLYDLRPGQSTIPGDISVSLVMNTLFGPIQIGGAAGATGHYKFFYQLGRVF
ncbi:MAG TPA: patatin-like phospholipase family protein [Terracidiphilus sp.]